MACSSLVVAALLVFSGHAALTNAATAYIVGDSKGWAIGVNYTSWASDKNFVIGDKLVFSYVSKEHTVTKVERSTYDACGGGKNKALSNDDSGLTTVPLDTAGDHFFICTVDNHCASGMMLSVTVAAPSTGGRLLLPAMTSIVAAALGALIKLLALL